MTLQNHQIGGLRVQKEGLWLFDNLLCQWHKRYHMGICAVPTVARCSAALRTDIVGFYARDFTHGVLRTEFYARIKVDFPCYLAFWKVDVVLLHETRHAPAAAALGVCNK